MRVVGWERAQFDVVKLIQWIDQGRNDSPGAHKTKAKGSVEYGAETSRSDRNLPRPGPPNDATSRLPRGQIRFVSAVCGKRNQLDLRARRVMPKQGRQAEFIDRGIDPALVGKQKETGLDA